MLRPSDALTKTKIVASDSIRRKVVFSRLLKMFLLSISDAKKTTIALLLQLFLSEGPFKVGQKIFSHIIFS